MTTSTFAITSRTSPMPVEPSYLAATFRNQKMEKVEFDAANTEHRAAYVQFKSTGRWSIQFQTKWPKSIQITVEEKLALYACRNECN